MMEYGSINQVKLGSHIYTTDYHGTHMRTHLNHH